jgi:hypothetical protein
MQRYELSKQLDLVLHSATNLEFHERFFTTNYRFFGLTAFQEEKEELPLQLQKVFPITL